MPTLLNTLGDSSPTRELVIKRVFHARRQRVFQAWTNPLEVAQWWGPEGFSSPRCEWDARKDGAIHVDMRGPDGSVYPMTGTFLAVDPPEKIVFVAYPDNGKGQALIRSTTTVTFADLGESTEITIHAVVDAITEEGNEALGGMNIGWHQSLDRFNAYAINSPGDAFDREIVVMRLFNASRERVFAAWSDAEHIGKWWGPRGFTTTTRSMDFRVGGQWHYTMHGPDGMDFRDRMTYREITQPERIAYDLDGDGADGAPSPTFRVTVTFAEESGQTRLTLRMICETAEGCAQVKSYGAVQGGQETLARLDEHLEATA